MSSPRSFRLLVALLSASLIGARPVPHDVWVGTAMPTDGGAMRGVLEMFAGKPPNTTFVELALRNDLPGAMRVWHVGQGTCAKPSMIFGDSAAYPVIRIGNDGKGVGAVTLRLTLPDTGDFHVAIAASPRNSRRVACGDLVLED
ncbi:hypothetical protein [Gemmatimonas sp. UBA7669]|jgi:hypothetical protein|uniref:hypothetical protein n=1 Tax=Gemmatimonas sp. UBA7669 TaxID=1946568 RepID=UPI0025C45C0E|nr:hypothetical protein [Gemmatimonas sp. UBA7669]